MLVFGINVEGFRNILDIKIQIVLSVKKLTDITEV